METTNDDRPVTQRSHKDPESCPQYSRQRRPTITRSRSPVRTRSFSGRLPGPPRRLSVDELVPLAAEREEFDEQHSDNHSNRDGSQQDYQSLLHDLTPGGKTTPRTMNKIKVEPADPEPVPDESSALVLAAPSAQASNQRAASAQQAPRIVPSLFAPVHGKVPSFSDFNLARPPPEPSTPIPTLPTGNAWDASIDDPLSSRTMHRLIATTCAKHRPPLGIDIPGRTHAEVLRAWASTVPASVDLGSAYWMLETGGEAALSGVKRRRVASVARLASASAMHELLVSQGYTFVDTDDDEDEVRELATMADPLAADDSDPDAEGEPDEDEPFGEFDDGGGGSSSSALTAQPFQRGAAASHRGPAYIYNATRTVHRPTPRPSSAAAASSHHLVRVHLSSAPAYHPWTPPTQGAFAAGESSTPLFDSMYISREVTSSGGGAAPTLTYVLNGPHRRLPMLGGLSFD
ncbi:hypothetical protein HDU87_001768 [Geranomyces variabilis]|uniref:Uncharacterized protein n=1 Tax=Geranomyces variabilis TaxID=109894 RepID=A0AAD5TNT1_9FUNG|nr:hypothetical protein HDU87_001768 [Geranomyces variabilis]